MRFQKLYLNYFEIGRIINLAIYGSVIFFLGKCLCKNVINEKCDFLFNLINEKNNFERILDFTLFKIKLILFTSFK